MKKQQFSQKEYQSLQEEVAKTTRGSQEGVAKFQKLKQVAKKKWKQQGSHDKQQRSKGNIAKLKRKFSKVSEKG